MNSPEPKYLCVGTTQHPHTPIVYRESNAPDGTCPLCAIIEHLDMVRVELKKEIYKRRLLEKTLVPSDCSHRHKQRERT